MKIYGWEEQNECQWGVECREYTPSESMKQDEGGLYCCPWLPHGDWYRTYAHAKRACLALWRERADTARRALKDVRMTRKAMVE
jgi:hypothetical protein